MKRVFDRTFWLYCLLGLLNYGVCNAVMLFLNVALALPETTSLLVEFSLQTLISFALNRYVTFRGCQVSRFWLLFSLLIVGLCYLLTRVLLRDLFLLLLQTAGLQAICAGLRSGLGISMAQPVFNQKLVMLLCTFTYSVVNYFGQRYLVFRPGKQQEETT